MHSKKDGPMKRMSNKMHYTFKVLQPFLLFLQQQINGTSCAKITTARDTAFQILDFLQNCIMYRCILLYT